MALDPSNGWSYYKKIDISDAGNVSADYQMKLTIHKGAGDDDTATGTIYCDNKCLDFHDDIRFGTTNNPVTATQLDQWVESSDADTAVIWVKCPTDGANTFYLFVGRATTDEFSDGEATFLFFDDFSGTTMNDDKWDEEIAAGVDWSTDGKVAISDGGRIWTDDEFGPNIRVRSSSICDEQDVRFIDISENPLDATNRIILSNSDSQMNDDFDDFTVQTVKTSTTRTNTSSNFLDFRAAYRTYEITWTANNVYFYQNDVEVAHHTTNILDASDHVGHSVWDSSQESTLTVDWIFIAKFSDTEPSWDSFGAWTILVVEVLKPGAVARKIGLPTPINVGVGM